MLVDLGKIVLIVVIMMVVIEGMICGVCILVVEEGFKNLDGILCFNISLFVEWVVIIYDLIKILVDKIVEIIEDRGFDIKILLMVFEFLDLLSGGLLIV